MVTIASWARAISVASARASASCRSSDMSVTPPGRGQRAEMAKRGEGCQTGGKLRSRHVTVLLARRRGTVRSMWSVMTGGGPPWWPLRRQCRDLVSGLADVLAFGLGHRGNEPGQQASRAAWICRPRSRRGGARG